MTYVKEKNMNKIMLIGRLTRDPEIRYSTNDNNTAIARYTLAVNRPFRKNGEQQPGRTESLHDGRCGGTAGISGEKSR